VIEDVDEALKGLLKRDALGGSSDVEISFDAPNTEWASRRSGPAVNVYLYDIREDAQRRQLAYERIRGDDGIVTGHKQPPRRFKLSYLLTAWTQRPEDEHRLLSACLATLLRNETMPADLLTGSLAGLPASLVTVALPTGGDRQSGDRQISEIWTALGGELKPSLDVAVNAPFDVSIERIAAPPVREEPAIDVRTADGTRERPARPRREAPTGPVPLAARLADSGPAELVHGSGARGDDAESLDTSKPGRWLTTRGAG
jgi:hypothetical protein